MQEKLENDFFAILDNFTRLMILENYFLTFMFILMFCWLLDSSWWTVDLQWTEVMIEFSAFYMKTILAENQLLLIQLVSTCSHRHTFMVFSILMITVVSYPHQKTMYYGVWLTQFPLTKIQLKVAMTNWSPLVKLFL